MPKDTGPRMEMRALLAIILSMLVLTVYQYFFVPPPPELAAPEASGREVFEPDAPEREAARGPAAGTVPEPAGAGAPTLPTGAAGQTIVAVAEQRVLVQSALYRATISNVGGRLESLILEDYQATTGGPLELVNPAAAAAGILPFGLDSPSQPGAAAAANAALFVMDVEGGRRQGNARIPTAGSPVRVRLNWVDGGWAVQKTLTFGVTGNQIGVQLMARGPGGVPLYLSAGAGLDPAEGGSRNVFLGDDALVLRGTELEHWDAGDLEVPVSFGGSVRWAGIESHYFLSAFLIDAAADVVLSRVTVAGLPSEEDEAPEEQELVSVALRIPDTGLDLPLFVGPKKYDFLQTEGYGLDRVVDFGWFGIIARPLLFMLNWIHGFVGNYGLAIILLTGLLRVVFWPLNHKAMVSMRKTQSLQPQMAAIRGKYKGVKDAEKRQKMNEEVMALYKREGVSPLGGCLPMVAQMPILFAFYRLLSIAIELRGAPFMLWVQDLSQYDPYLVLPLLMGASMLVQQRMTPTVGVNPSQASVMKMMPVMFTFLFLWVPSGLVLYWLVNNLLGIAQQVYVKRHVDQANNSTKAPHKGKKGKKSQRGKR